MISMSHFILSRILSKQKVETTIEREEREDVPS